MLGAADDGGSGHDSSEGDNTPLLATLTSDSWLVRRAATAAGGLFGNVADSGETSNGLMGLSGRRAPLARLRTSGGGPSALRSGREAVRHGWVTGGGRVP